jgi:hypothetical protein
MVQQIAMNEEKSTVSASARRPYWTAAANAARTRLHMTDLSIAPARDSLAAKRGPDSLERKPSGSAAPR